MRIHDLVARGLGLLMGAFLSLTPGCSKSPSHTTFEVPATNALVDAKSWFEEVAEETGLIFRHSSGHSKRFYMPEVVTGGVGLLDFDNDGFLDVYAVTGGSILSGSKESGNKLFRNLGNGKFADVTITAGVEDQNHYGIGCACGDFDNDGWTDLFVSNLNGNVLYRNNGNGTFTDATTVTGVGAPSFSTSAAFFDFDNDQDLDLIVINYLRWSPATEVNCFSRGGIEDYCSPLNYKAPAMATLFRNEGGGKFKDISREAGLDKAYGNGMGVATGDFNQDGWIDFFVANDAMPNQLWMNQGNGSFKDESMVRGCAVNAFGIPRAGMGVVAVDLFQDSYLDLFVTHLVGEGNGLFQNSKGYFTDLINPKGPAAASFPFTGFGLGFYDFNHDGELDLYVANGRARYGATDLDPADPYAEPNTLLKGAGKGLFEVIPGGGLKQELFAASRGAAFGDMDNDGDVDVVINNKDNRLHYLRNNRGNDGGWIMFDLRTSENTSARNAVLEIRLGEKTLWRQVQPNEGYCSSQDHRVHCGLGPQKKVDGLKVHWRSGIVQDFGSLPGGQIHILRQLRR